MRVKSTIFFHGPDICARLQQRRGEGAESRADFNYGVAGDDLRELERFADDVAVDEKILAEKFLRRMSQLREQVGTALRAVRSALRANAFISLRGRLGEPSLPRTCGSKTIMAFSRISAGRGPRPLRSNRKT
jgi:hypothetical protein